MTISQSTAKSLAANIRNGTGSKDLAETLLSMLAGDVTGWRDTRSTPLFSQGAATALNATGTLTVAMMLGGLVTSTTAAAVTATLDTGALLETALLALYPNLAVNDYFEFSIINTGGTNAVTVATASGWTDGGGGFTAAPAAQIVARYGVRRTAAGAYTLYRVG